MGLYRKTSGLIFDEKFGRGDAQDRWLCSPSGSVLLDSSNQQLILSHSESDTMALFDLPSGEKSILLEVTADYVPTKTGDEGGIVIWKDGYHTLEFLESMDSTTEEYSKWRAAKQGNQWTFYAERGHGWEIFDSAVLVGQKAGVIVKNKQMDGYESMKVKRVVVCRGTRITVGNLGEGYAVYLCNKEGHAYATGTVEKGWTGVEFSLPSVPFDGMIKVFDQNGVEISAITAEMYGGDVFLFGTDLEILWNQRLLSPVESNDLGTMYDDKILVQMQLRNPSSATWAKQTRLRLLQYKEDMGYQWVDLAQDAAGTPGDFVDVLDFGTIAPQETREFWIRVERIDDTFRIEPAHFLLDISHL